MKICCLLQAVRQKLACLRHMQYQQVTKNLEEAWGVLSIAHKICGVMRLPLSSLPHWRGGGRSMRASSRAAAFALLICSPKLFAAHAQQSSCLGSVPHPWNVLGCFCWCGAKHIWNVVQAPNGWLAPSAPLSALRAPEMTATPNLCSSG